MTHDSTCSKLFEYAPVGILVLDADGLVVEMNREARRTLARSEEQVVGRPILASVAPRDRERVKAAFLRVLQGQMKGWVASFTRGDGTTRAQRVRAVPVDQEPTSRILLFFRNLTEVASGHPDTKQVQTLLENLPGQFIVAVDGEGRIRYSSGLSRTFFRDDTSSIGHPFESLLDDAADRERFSVLRAAATQGDPWAGMLWCRRMDGVALPMRVFSIPHRDTSSGRVLGALLAGRDVTEEKQAEDRLRASRAMSTLGEMTEQVAAAARMGAERALELLDGAGAARYGTLAGVAEELTAIRRMGESVARFSNSARVERGTVDLQAAVFSSLHRFRPYMEVLDVEVRLDLSPDLPPVPADPAAVGRILRILLENSLESLQGCRGKEPRVIITARVNEERVFVDVSDSGCGVPSEIAHRVFDPMVSGKVGHTGLGLAAALGMAQAMGGTLRLVHDGHDGEELATFRLELPLEPPGSEQKFRPAPLALSRVRSILIADDEDSVRGSLRQLLERVGFEVREAWSGRSALAQITVSAPPEMVLTDLKMSDGNGYWFLEQLSRDFPDLLRRTVIITGDSQHPRVSSVAEQTGCPVIQKPVELPVLLEVLDEVARRP
ncbi:MAG: PAS domain-containing protein [Gemmatimonadota bacterium]